MADAVASGVGLIDSNRLVELVATDGIGMILPRTAMAFKMRGPDDGRETFLREMSGLVGNTFLVGWASRAMLGMLGNSVNRYNKQGIPGQAWVSSENLDLFGKLYKASLEKAKKDTTPKIASESHFSLFSHSFAHQTPAESAREDFIHRVLSKLESGDKHFSIESRVASLQKLSGKGQQQALAQMVESIGDMDHLGDYQALLSKPDALKQKFLQNDWGRLSEESRDALSDYFRQPRYGIRDTLKGTNNFDDRAAERVRELLPREAPTSKAYKQAFLKQRLAFSLDDLRSEAAEFQKAVDHEALARGLTGTVNLRDKTGKVISHDQSRGALLKELKFFLEQYVDRATYAAKGDLTQIHKRLFQDGKPGIVAKLIPHAEDGLITAAKKSKLAFTWIPMLFAVMAGGGFTFYNNYLTSKKHGGKVFFPGEGGPGHEPPPAPTTATALPFSGTAANTFAQSPFRSTLASYPNFRQPFGPHRNPQGGSLA